MTYLILQRRILLMILVFFVGNANLFIGGHNNKISKKKYKLENKINSYIVALQVLRRRLDWVTQEYFNDKNSNQSYTQRLKSERRFNKDKTEICTRTRLFRKDLRVLKLKYNNLLDNQPLIIEEDVNDEVVDSESEIGLLLLDADTEEDGSDADDEKEE